MPVSSPNRPSVARLEMAGVQKAFGVTHALRNVALSVAPGEAHALIGENGAGKSTLMKILSGAYQPDAGSITLDDQPFRPANPLHARECGIAMIYQELNLAPHLSVEENIVLGEEPARFGWLDRAKRRDLARRALEQLHHGDLPLTAPVNSLPIAQQQLVEIARALVREPKVLIMDEPTSSLTQVDTENLFRVIERLRARGVSVIYISHFLEECQRVCQRYTVLRDGETVGTGDMAAARVEDIIRLMVGREMKDIYPRTPHELGAPVLELKELAGRVKPRRVNLTLRAGEILGLAGLIGAGRTETARAVFGLDELAAGDVLVCGNGAADSVPSNRQSPIADRQSTGSLLTSAASRSPTDSLHAGLGLLSENRKEEGLMLNRSLADNLTATHLGPFARFGLLSTSRQHAATRDWMTRLDVRARGPEQPIGELSGGNQQKIALGRLLHHDARILLLDEPTRGIDVGSKAHIYRLIGELAAQGKAVLFISSYLPELLGVCDTIGVMCRGELVATRPAAEWTEHEIIAAAIGH
ncbi:MAG: Ribose import ATP-binding protein RbsA [Verrucomicrobiota bacterium]|jgi:ribose transport system ATP-binding protein